MTISIHQTDTRVRQLENHATHNPRGYKLRVLLLAVLGYAYVFAILGVLILLIGLCVGWIVTVRSGSSLALRFAFPLAFLAFVIGRALWVKLTPPTGLPVQQSQAPQLFEALEQVRYALKGPKVHTVLVTDEFNAGVVQIPRLGIFGWHHNYLVLGLPLMQALSPDQFRAVLAHEFGHLAGAHSSFSAWIYRVRGTWYQLMEKLEQDEHWGAVLFRRFFGWYAPFFQAYTFVLARSHEYQADRCAAELVGPVVAADALVQVRLGNMFLQRQFWPTLFSRVELQPAPPQTPYIDMVQSFQDGTARPNAETWLYEALLIETGSTDTHPSLADRLANLEQEARVPVVSQVSSAEHFLGRSTSELRAQLNHAWLDEVEEEWQQRHVYIQEGQKRLQELERQAQQAPLGAEELWEQARLSEEFVDSATALPLYQQVVAVRADFAGGYFALGRALLQTGQASGIQTVERSMELDADYVLPGCEMIAEFLVMHDQPDTAEQYQQRAAERAQLLALAQDERDSLGFRDTYLPHGLNSEQLAAIKQQLADYPEIWEAYLVRKAVTHLPESPLYALGVTLRRNWFSFDQRLAARQIVGKLAAEVEWPGETMVVPLHKQNVRLKRIMVRVNGSRIYPDAA